MCAGTTGPGSTHLVAGLYEASRDHAPVLALSGDMPRKMQGIDFLPAYQDACQRWLRQAGAVTLLIGFNFFNGCGAAGQTIGRIYEPELKPTLFVESIDKIELSENIKRRFFSH